MLRYIPWFEPILCQDSWYLTYTPSSVWESLFKNIFFYILLFLFCLMRLLFSDLFTLGNFRSWAACVHEWRKQKYWRNPSKSLQKRNTAKNGCRHFNYREIFFLCQTPRLFLQASIFHVSKLQQWQKLSLISVFFGRLIELLFFPFFFSKSEENQSFINKHKIIAFPPPQNK